MHGCQTLQSCVSYSDYITVASDHKAHLSFINIVMTYLVSGLVRSRAGNVFILARHATFCVFTSLRLMGPLPSDKYLSFFGVIKSAFEAQQDKKGELSKVSDGPCVFCG